MSIKNLQKKASLVVCLLFFGSMVVGFLKQVETYIRVKKRLTEREKELASLEEINKRLKNKEEQIFGGEVSLIPTKEEKPQEEKLPNYQKWWNLFSK